MSVGESSLVSKEKALMRFKSWHVGSLSSSHTVYVKVSLTRPVMLEKKKSRDLYSLFSSVCAWKEISLMSQS